MTPAVLCAIAKQTDAKVPRMAGDLAASLGTSVVLTHVAETGRPFRLSGGERAVADAGSSGAPLSRARFEIAEDIAVEERRELGSPPQRLCELADEEKVELIVTGWRGRGALRSALFGSVSRELARRASCPVLIVPPRASVPMSVGDAPAARGVICGVARPDRSLAIVRFADNLASRLGDRLSLVHVNEAGPVAVQITMDEALAKALESVAAGTRAFVETGAPPGYALAAVAARERARLIVVGAGGLGDARPRLTSPSASAQLLAQVACPVLLLPERASLPYASQAEVDRAA